MARARTAARVSSLIVAAAAATAAAALLAGCGRQGANGTAIFPFFSKPATAADVQRVAPRPIERPVRAIWVARYHYRNPDDIRKILQNCAALGMNTVLWQVRGQATVAYPSQIEPWAVEYGYQDPGFDPLSIAVAEAHRQGLRIEAWVNVMPGWKGEKPPPVRNHLYHTHPEWFLHDAAGRQQPLNPDYVVLNPCLPEVRRHIVAVIDEIVSRYAVDGIHLDYVRYAWESTPGAAEKYPRDPRTIALFRRETGRGPEDDALAWRDWRVNQLTRLVVEIDRTLAARRPGASLTAAVWRRPEIGYRSYLQNAVAWLRSGVVDAIMPMAYTANLFQFEDDLQAYRMLAPQALIVPGMGIYTHATPAEMNAQLDACRRRGGDFALFSYESLFPTAGENSSRAPSAKAQPLREMRRAVLAAFAGSRPTRDQ